MSSNFCIHRRGGTLCWPTYLNEIVCRRKGRRARGEPPAGLVFSFFGSVYSMSSSIISLTKISIYLFKTALPPLSAQNVCGGAPALADSADTQGIFSLPSFSRPKPRGFCFPSPFFTYTLARQPPAYSNSAFFILWYVHLSRFLRSHIAKGVVKLTLLNDDGMLFFLEICCRA